MKLEFTPAGGELATLGDDALKYTIVIEQLGGQSLAQIESLAGGANPAQFPRGNVGGEFIFTSSKTYADYKTTFTQFLLEYARLNQQGALVLTQGPATDVTMTFANAILKGVQRVFGGQNTGTRMGIRYTFAITTIT